MRSKLPLILLTALVAPCFAAPALAETFAFSTPISGDGVAVRVSLRDLAGGDGVEVSVSIPVGAGDLLGVFGNVGDESLVPQLALSDASGLVTQWQFLANAVWKVGAGNSMAPVQTWDWGVRLGEAGSSAGALEAASFALSAPGLSVDQLLSAAAEGWVLGVRIQSTGGAEGSAKIGRSDQAPRVAIGAPIDGAAVSESSVSVSGAVSGAAPLAVSVNGIPAAVTAGSYSVEVPLTPGLNPIDAVASNAFGSASASIEVDLVPVTNSPPVLDPIGDRSVPIGATLSFQLGASDADGDPLTFSVAPLPLPAGASFHAATGAFQFAPSLAQLGDIELAFAVSDGQASDGEAIRISVTGPAPGDPTAISGRMLDANDAAAGVATPIAGVTIRDLDVGIATTSDSSGLFTLSGIPAGTRRIEFDGSTATSALAYGSYRASKEILSNVTLVLDRPIYLPRIDTSAVAVIDPTQTVVVENASIGVTLAIPPHTVKTESGADYTGELSISVVPVGFTPGALPDTLEPSLVITIQPMGLVFAQPVPFVFPNLDALPPGSQVNLWSLDHKTGRFFIAGVGEVSPGGATIETVSGGVQETSWHSVISPAASASKSGQGEGDNNACPAGESAAVASDVLVSNGVLSADFALPEYVSQDRARTARFVYRSDVAYPQPAIPFEPTILLRAAVPPKLSYRINVAGVNTGAETFVDTTSLSESLDETIRVAAAFDASALETGAYPVSVRTTSHYASSRVSTDIGEEVVVVNGRASPFGAGWGLDGLQRVHVGENLDALVTQGDGSHALFRPALAAAASAVSGALIQIQPPPDVGTGAAQCRHRIQSFTEQTGVVLSSDLQTDLSEPGVYGNVPADAALIAAGTAVTSHLILLDPAGGFPTLSGSIRFERPILGLLTTDGALTASDAELGAPDTLYGVGNRAAFDDGTSDRVTLSADRRELDVQLFVGDDASTDQIRVITEAEPGEANPVVFVDTFDCDNEGFGQANFSNFRSWMVTSGFVDLIGLGVFGSTSSNQRVELDGSGPLTGQMQTREPIDLEPGLYTLSFSISNVRGDGGDNQALVDLGSAYSETFSFSDDAGVMPVVRVISVAGPESPRLVLDSSADAADGHGVVILGIALRRGVAAGAEPGDFRSPAGDASILVRNPGDTFTRRLKDGTEFHFDQNGLQTGRVDRNGNTTLYGYDAQGRLETILDPVGLATSFAYLGDHLSSVTDPASRVTEFDHDAGGNLIRVTFPDGSTREFDYDARHLLTDEIDARNLLTRHRYDGLGRLVDATLPDGSLRSASNAQTVGYADLSGGLGSEANPAPVVRPQAATSAITDAEGRTRTFETAAFGAATAIIDAAGLRTEIGRDANGNAIRTERPSGDVFERRFDARSNLLSAKDVLLNGTTEFSYDPQFSRLTSITDPFDETTAFGQDASGNLTSIATPEGRTTTFTRTATGQVATLTDPLGTLTTFAYDAEGNLSELRQSTGPEQRLTTFTYTAEGLVDTVTDAASRVTDFDYDAMGRIVRQQLPDGEVVDFEYDAAGNLSALGPPGRPFHLFAYDDRNRESVYDPPPVTAADPATVFSYDREGLLTRVDRPDGQSLALAYDGAGRLDALTLPRGVIDLQYRATTGLLDRIIDTDGGAIDFGYLGSRPISETWSGAISGSVAITLDPDGSLASRSVNGAHSAVFDYDADARLTQAGAETLQRNPTTGLLAGTTLGSVTTSLGYNAFAERSSDSAAFGATPLYANTYARDELGRIVQETETIGGTTTVYDYAYDAAGRLAEVQTGGLVTASYTYDANGNRLSATTAASGTEAGSYDDQDRLLSYGTNTYAYTENGELASKTNTALSETTLYDYDLLGNLRRVDLPDGTVIEYLIDGANRRIGKKVNGLLVQGLLYGDQLNPAAELDSLGNVTSRFVYGSKPNVPDYMVLSGITYAIVSDHLGSVRLVVDANTGAIAQRIDYDEFGNVTLDTNPGFQPFGFAGGLYDADTGLVRFGARDYDPEVGRWTAKDPIRFGGGDTSLYGYVLGDPMNFVDQDGRILNIIGGAIGGAVVGAATGAIVGGVASAVSGGSFSEGFNQGLTLGAATGAIIGGLAAGGIIFAPSAASGFLRGLAAGLDAGGIGGLGAAAAIILKPGDAGGACSNGDDPAVNSENSNP